MWPVAVASLMWSMDPSSDLRFLYSFENFFSWSSSSPRASFLSSSSFCFCHWCPFSVPCVFVFFVPFGFLFRGFLGSRSSLSAWLGFRRFCVVVYGASSKSSEFSWFENPHGLKSHSTLLQLLPCICPCFLISAHTVPGAVPCTTMRIPSLLPFVYASSSQVL